MVSDVLASRDVPESAKRATILLAISRYKDTTSFIKPQEEWLSMSSEMEGVDTTRLVSAVSSCR